ncbi:hypothetical protein ACR42D_10170 [Desulfovibrio caledoniensis]
MHTPLTARPLLPLLLALLLLPACAPKTPQTQQEWTDLANEQVMQCLNGNRRACKKLDELKNGYDKAYPCPYTAMPQSTENKLQDLTLGIFRGNVAALDTAIEEARKNNYGDCLARASLATSLRFLKAFGLYMAKNYPESARTFKVALSEIGPDNGMDDEMTPLTLAFYPAALIKSGKIEQAKEVLGTPLYTPIQAVLKEHKVPFTPFVKYTGELLLIPEPQNYSLPTLALAGFIKDRSQGQSSLNPTALAFIDALQTIAPHTPVPDFILDYPQSAPKE